VTETPRTYSFRSRRRCSARGRGPKQRCAVVLSTLLALLAHGGISSTLSWAQSSVQVWTLEGLGFDTADLTKLSALPRLSFDLPADARQGPSEWYVFHLHYSIDFDPLSFGHGSLSVLTNDRAASQVTFDTVADQPPRYSTVGLVSGYVAAQADGYTVEDRYANYLQLDGVKPGRNEMVVGLEVEPSVRLNHLTIFGDSFLERTSATPYTLDVRMPNGINRKLQSGKPFSVPYTISAAAGRVVPDVKVRSDVSNGLHVVGPIVQSIGDVSGEWSGSFEYEAEEKGRFQITLTARGAGFNQPQQTVELTVGEHGSEPSLYGLLGVAGTLFVVCWVFVHPGPTRRRRYSPGRRILVAGGALVVLVAAVLSLLSFDRGDSWCGSVVRSQRSGQACAKALGERRHLVGGLALLGTGLALTGGLRRRAKAEVRSESERVI
jgi:hypothetical protein